MIDDRHAGRILAEMVHIARTFQRAGQRSRERSLGGTEFGILQYLRESDARLGELAQGLQVSAAVTSRAVDSLEAEGLVERRPDPHDARAALISITAAGRTRLGERESEVVARFAEALGDWSAADAEQAIALLNRLNRHLGRSLVRRSGPSHRIRTCPRPPGRAPPTADLRRRGRTTSDDDIPTAVPAMDEYRQYSHREILEVMTALLAALFTAMISTTIVSTALPTIIADLDGTQRQYTWVITVSLLAMTVSTPVWGKLSDLFNKKLLTQIAIVMFVVGSVVAGLSTSITLMMVARAVQGLAMGGLMALVQAIMGTIMAPRERGRYAGYMGAVMAVATVSVLSSAV